jgi:hypothetical protein
MLLERQGMASVFSSPLVLINGQSNADGRDTDTTGWTPDPRVVYYLDGAPATFGPSGGQHGCELTLGNALAQAQGGAVTLGKHGVGGTFIADWVPTGSLWSGLAAFLTTFAALTPQKLCHLWWQGESEGADPTYGPGGTARALYLASLQQLYAGIRGVYPFQVRPFLVKLNAVWLAPGGLCAANGAAINAAIDDYVGSDPLAQSIVIPLTPAGGIHYVNGQQLTIGTSYVAPPVVKYFRG